MNISFSTNSKHHWLICVMFPDASAISSFVFKFCPLNWIRCSFFSSNKVVWWLKKKKKMKLLKDNANATLCRQVVHTKSAKDSLTSAKSWSPPSPHLQLQLTWLPWCLTKDEGVIHPLDVWYVPEHFGIHKLFSHLYK